jgi:photosystem II stability/assembly factor-like uncharacterized protein
MKKSYYLLTAVILLLVLSIRITYAQIGWYNMNSPIAGYPVQGIYFSDVNNGVTDEWRTTNSGVNWITMTGVGGYAMDGPSPSAVYVSGGGIQKTTNMGVNWVSQTIPPQAGNIKYGIYFLNNQTGWSSGDFSTIIKTTNGGTNWILQNYLSGGNNMEYFLNDIYFINANTGFCVGYTHTFGFDTSVIMKSVDGGTSWSRRTFPGTDMFMSVCFVDDNTGIVGGLNGMYRTTDCGSNWNEIPYYGGWARKLCFPSHNIGYGAGGSGIIKTTDAGLTWWRQSTSYGDLECIYFINDMTGFAGGETSSHTVILKTTNGGGPHPPLTPTLISPPDNATGVSLTPLLDWSDDAANSSKYIVQVSTSYFFSNPVVSDSVTSSQYSVPSGKLANYEYYYWRVRGENYGGYGDWCEPWEFRTSPIGIKKISTEIPKEYLLYNNYPNPFNPSTTMRFDLPKSSETKIIVYDLSGGEVEVLANENYEAGKYEVSWDASNYASGVYFVRFIAGDYAKTMRIALIK